MNNIVFAVNIKATLEDGSEVDNVTGEIISDNLEIACKELSIKVLLIQREGKRPQETSEFLLGSQMKKGSLLNNV